MLENCDSGMLIAFAQTWGVSLNKLTNEKKIDALEKAMLNPEGVEALWDAMTDQQRGVLQMLLSQKDRRMPTVQFCTLNGKIRKMGRAEIETFLPHKNPETVSEALFYRGFIAEGTDPKPTLRPVIYIPADLAKLLPIHKTSYASKLLLEAADEVEDDEDWLDASDELEDSNSAEIRILPVDESQVHQPQAADTSIIDDMVTLLAYLRREPAGVEAEAFLPAHAERILPYLLKPEQARLNFLLGVGITAELIQVQDGLAYARRDGLQRWLSQPRHAQLRALAQAWLDTPLYKEIWQLAGLYPDPDHFAYDPRLARQVILSAFQHTPPKSWWMIVQLVQFIKHEAPDFQRANFDSWYIQDEQQAYLKGFESWDAIEGAQLSFIVLAPLHWLGMVDIAAGCARLTVYGRGLANIDRYPTPPDAEEKIMLHADGTLSASRKVPRHERFLLARFSQWLGFQNDAYHYRLDHKSLARASEQGIQPHQIEAFLRRHSDKELPSAILRLLNSPTPSAATQMSLERVLVLRTTSKEMLDYLFNEPKLRRYLGARLGDMAVIVRADGAQALQEALEAQDLRVEFIGD